MGVLSQVKETMMKSLIVIALVAAVAQASVVETEFVQEGSAPSDDNFSAAQSRVESMLEMDTRARRSACVKAADASINNVFKEVQNAQRSLNRLDNGRRCASRNQHLINRAQHTIRLRQRQLNTANCAVGQYRGGGHGINYRGYFYRSLGGAHVHGHRNGCDNHFRTIPKGCRVNPSAAVNTYMGKRYRWSTHVLCSVGVCHNTVGYSVAGRKWSNNNIRYSGHCSAAHQRAGRCRAKTNTCSLRIFLQCKK